MTRFIDIAEKFAILLSSLCIIHCVLFPVVLIALPSVSLLLSFDSELIHYWLLFAVIPICTFAVIYGYRIHKNWRILVLGSLGVSILLVGFIFGHDMFWGFGETVLTVLGSILVAVTHFKNLQLRHSRRNLHQ